MNETGNMQLKILLPTETLVDTPVQKIVAEAENGSFCLLPRHIDFIAAIVPGILEFVDDEGREEFLAVDEGMLVKRGREVLISIRSGIRGGSLGELREMVQERFRHLDEQQRKNRAIMARLEAGFVRQFIQLEENPYG